MSKLIPKIDCNEVKEPQLLVSYFRQNDEHVLIRVLNCFNDLFFKSFKKSFCRKVFSKWPHTRYKEDDLSRDAFNDGLLSFYNAIRRKGFEERGATIESLFYMFCENKLLGLIKSIERMHKRQAVGDPDLIIEKKSETAADGYIDLKEEQERMDRRKETLSKAFHILGERDTNLILWRKMDKLGNAEIAGRMNIASGSVNNEVYKSFIKLKKIVAGLEAENKT